MKVGILGAGAIGCAVGGRLALGGAEVVLVGRPAVGERVRAGLTLSRWGEPAVEVPGDRLRFATEPEAVHGCDVVLVTTKSRDTRSAARSLVGLPVGVPVGSLQNGVHNPEVLAEELPGRTIWPGVVSFNVVWADDGRRLHQGTSGPIVLPVGAEAVVAALRAGGAQATTAPDVVAVQWGKLLINLNNAVNALSGLPLRQMLSDRGYRRIVAAVVQEGRGVLRAAGIRVRGMGRIQPALVAPVLRLPDLLFFRVAGAMIRIDPEASSSMADDLRRGRPTEVDELNGEIMRIAAGIGRTAPLNAGLVRLVEAAESPPRRWSADELGRAIGCRA